MIIRRATEDDLSELIRIEEETFGREKFSTDVVLAFIVRGDAFTIVAYDEKERRVVGSAACLVSEDTGEGRIASIAVQKSHRAQGVGSDLLAECERLLKGFRLSKYVLEVETTNMPAILLYTDRGYKTVRMLKDYYGLGRDAYAMEKRLGGTCRKLIVR